MRVDRARSDAVVARVRARVPVGSRTVDIGSGGCIVCRKLRALGYEVQPFDVRDLSIFPEIRPLLYDGRRLPFSNDRFDAALLITDLHHTSDPVLVLREAARVAPSIVITGDIYEGTREKYATFAMDALVNHEFRGHPHTNKTKAEWRALFRTLRLTLRDAERFRFWKFFAGATDHLVREKALP